MNELIINLIIGAAMVLFYIIWSRTVKRDKNNVKKFKTKQDNKSDGNMEKIVSGRYNCDPCNEVTQKTNREARLYKDPWD